MVQDQFQILLFEKNESIGTLLCEFMQMENFKAEMFTDREAAIQAYTAKNFPICIISFESASAEEGFTLAKKVTAINPGVILIFMSTNPTIDTLSEAYNSGADDFIRKPFILEELQMRMLAIIRRTRGVKMPEAQSYLIGKYLLDTKKQTLTFNDVTQKITTKETDLLKFLCENANNLVLREDILKSVWKNDSYYNARSMDVYITKLRRLLKEDKYVGIINVHGKGYKLLIIEP
ncbi:transcriptional regulatory protein RprY [Bacteroidia bacterium]|nr:transcriptional regulatory protein RprY [Bacteroidia bacterium]